ncbi:MAG TPA: TetR family transcriptional regulator [Gaiellaceae bacterium]|jgi:AcrR family transcriptional regulator|nr:TetR family transcriptional regulator [Gaiellaceae bacterium]
MATGRTSADARRGKIREAAVRVFARKGFHAARVGDIAAEAGVAHGLMYHYYESKDALLESVFRETWAAMLELIREIEESGEPAREQLRRVAAVVLRTWRRDPDLVRVLVREVTRTPQIQRQAEEVGLAFEAIERIVRYGQERGEFRTDLDARLAALVLYGALEEILTGWVIGQLPDTDEDIARAEHVVVEVLTGGLAKE